MKFCQVIGVLITAFVLTVSWDAHAQARELKMSDVKGMMSELLDQHFGGGTMTPEILQDSIGHYIEGADPSHLYLMASEVEALKKVDPQMLQRALTQYNNGNYAFFEQINGVIQQGIERARKLRSFDSATREALFRDARRVEMRQGEGEEKEYRTPATSEDELVKRLKADFIDFVLDQMDRFGVEQVLNNEGIVANKYEEHLQRVENAYLFQSAEGQAMANADRDNQFSLHILKALAKSLDAHTSFLNEDEAIDMKMRLEKGFSGVGIVVKEVIDGFVVTDLVADAPAMRSGQVKINDRLVKVNGRPVLGMSMDEVTHLLREESMRDAVTLSLQHTGKEGLNLPIADVTLKPEMIIVNDGRVEKTFEKFGGGIVGTITLHSFYEGPKDISAANDVANAIADLKKEGKLMGLVLDLRDNSGGYLSQAVQVAGLFITNGVVVISKYSDGEIHYYRDLPGNQVYDGPLVVLTSRLTASAAEIVSQALQDYGVAVVVGDPHTYGKGTIQAQTVTDDHSQSHFKVTVGEFYTVSGKTTQLRGVQADVLLPGEFSQLQIGESFLKTSIVNDVMPAAYNDTLADVDPKVKAWYQKNYLPSLQPQEHLWQTLLPELKKRSASRTSSNPAYQYTLRQLAHQSVPQEHFVDLSHFDLSNYQLQEAEHIVEDMAVLKNHAPGDLQVSR